MRVGPGGSYLTGWIAWNHVRTLTCIAGAVTLVLALPSIERVDDLRVRLLAAPALR